MQVDIIVLAGLVLQEEAFSFGHRPETFQAGPGGLLEDIGGDFLGAQLLAPEGDVSHRTVKGGTVGRAP